MIENRSNRDLLYYIIYVCFRRKYLITFTFIATLLGLIFGAFLMQPTWKATAKILARYNPNQQIVIFKDLSVPFSDQGNRTKPGSNIVEMLTSRILAEEMVKSFHLDNRLYQRTEKPTELRDKITDLSHYIFLDYPTIFLANMGIGAVKKKNYLADAIDDVIKHWEDISQGDDTEVVTLTIWGHTPELARNVANAMAETVISKALNITLQKAEEAYDFISKQLPIVEANLVSSEASLKRYKEENDTVLLPSEQDANAKRIDSINADIVDLRSKLASMLIEKKEDHPDVKQIKMQLREKLGQLEKEREWGKSLDAKEFELNRLTRARDLADATYRNLKTRFDEIKVMKSSVISELKLNVIDPAFVPDDADTDWPSWKIVLPASVVLAILVGFTFAFLFEYWNDTSVKTSNEVAGVLDIPIISIIPNIRKIGLAGGFVRIPHKRMLPARKEEGTIDGTS